MIVKLFGILDLFAGIIVILTHLGLVPWNISIGFVMYLFIKSVMFRGDLMSMVDFLIGVYIIMMIFGFKFFLAYFFAFFLIQKGFFSLK